MRRFKPSITNKALSRSAPHARLGICWKLCCRCFQEICITQKWAQLASGCCPNVFKTNCSIQDEPILLFLLEDQENGPPAVSTNAENALVSTGTIKIGQKRISDKRNQTWATERLWSGRCSPQKESRGDHLTHRLVPFRRVKVEGLQPSLKDKDPETDTWCLSLLTDQKNLPESRDSRRQLRTAVLNQTAQQKPVCLFTSYSSDSHFNPRKLRTFFF